MEGKVIPVKEGEVIVARVSHVGGGGDPVLNFEGFKIIVKRATNWNEGSLLRVKITAIKESYAFAEVV
jgi:predicted RNA-binding protein with TRAM domain